jgi:hypothetical protein
MTHPALAMPHAGIHAEEIDPAQRDHRGETSKSEETVAPSPRAEHNASSILRDLRKPEVGSTVCMIEAKPKTLIGDRAYTCESRGIHFQLQL